MKKGEKSERYADRRSITTSKQDPNHETFAMFFKKSFYYYKSKKCPLQNI